MDIYAFHVVFYSFIFILEVFTYDFFLVCWYGLLPCLYVMSESVPCFFVVCEAVAIYNIGMTEVNYDYVIKTYIPKHDTRIYF